MFYNNEILVCVGIMETKNGRRIGSFNGEKETDNRVLAYWVTNKEASKLCKRYSDIFDIPIYNHKEDF